MNLPIAQRRYSWERRRPAAAPLSRTEPCGGGTPPLPARFTGAWCGYRRRKAFVRRLFLKQLVVACFVALSWFSATGAEPTITPAPEGSFSIVVIPDSQKYLGRGTKAQPKSTNEVTNAALQQHTRWIVNNLDRQRIVFVSHMGDIVDKNVTDQWIVARQCMDRLHGRVPYGISPGNHDHGRATQTTLFQQFFGATRFAGMPWYGGAFDGAREPKASGNNANSFQLFSAGGMEFVFLHLQCNAPDDVLQWADGILRQHAGRRALVTTHMGLGPLQRPKHEDEFTSGPKGLMQWKKCHGERGNTPEQMWQKCFRKHANLRLVFCGDQSRTQAMRLTLQNDHGKPVHVLLSDYMQDRGDWLRVCRFLPVKSRIEVRTVESRDGRICEGTKLLPGPAEHQFQLDYEMPKSNL
ncbi:MAG: metallophosphoesterase [Verrucomicrobia bacterium]|nr:metallophosphoesterase [Verrucomicrobiota bacterium]